MNTSSVEEEMFLRMVDEVELDMILEELTRTTGIAHPLQLIIRQARKR